MNAILLLAIGAAFSFLGAIVSGLVLHALRGQRDRINSVEAKTNENAEAIARLEGAFGRLGTHQNWREELTWPMSTNKQQAAGLIRQAKF